MGLTSELILQDTSEPLSAGLAMIPLSLTHQLPRQESAKGHLELFPLPEKETGWLCAVALLGGRVLRSSPSPAPKVQWCASFPSRPRFPSPFHEQVWERGTDLSLSSFITHSLWIIHNHNSNS